MILVHKHDVWRYAMLGWTLAGEWYGGMFMMEHPDA